jgi:hypothetical protein
MTSVSDHFYFYWLEFIHIGLVNYKILVQTLNAYLIFVFESNFAIIIHK